jgi:hypothetical protein
VAYVTDRRTDALAPTGRPAPWTWDRSTPSFDSSRATFDGALLGPVGTPNAVAAAQNARTEAVAVTTAVVPGAVVNDVRSVAGAQQARSISVPAPDARSVAAGYQRANINTALAQDVRITGLTSAGAGTARVSSQDAKTVAIASRNTNTD